MESVLWGISCWLLPDYSPGEQWETHGYMAVIGFQDSLSPSQEAHHPGRYVHCIVLSVPASWEHTKGAGATETRHRRAV